jgi:pyruvate carboxylase
VSLELEKGKSLLVKLVSIPPPNEDGIRQVIMELNGERWFVSITDEKAGAAVRRREKAGAPGTVGATMPGVIVDIKVKQGDFVKEGDQLAVRLIASDYHDFVKEGDQLAVRLIASDDQRFRQGRRPARGASDCL